MTVIFPEATPVLGNLKVAVLDTVATTTAPDLSSEIGAAGTVDISCFIRNWNVEISTNTGTAPPRVCTTLDLPQSGRSSMSPIELRYIYDPQDADDSSDENTLKAKLVEGTELFVVVRKGIPYATAFTAGDAVETYKVRVGRQNRVTSGDDDLAEFEISQYLYPIALPAYGQVVA
jgi:hypothetical protein